MTQPVNPRPARIAAFPVDTTFRVRGVLTGYEVSEREVPSFRGSTRMRTEKFAVITIDTTRGHVLEFEARSLPLQYSDGVHENLRGVEVRVGESVEMTIRVYLDDSLAKRTIIDSSSVELLVPDEERQRQYDDLREQVAAQITALSAHVDMAQFSEARGVFATIRKLDLTREERRHLKVIVDSLPAAEQPIYNKRSTSARDNIEKIYGINFETLNPEEFLALAREILHGERSKVVVDEHSDSSSLLHLFDESPFTAAQEHEMVASTIKVRFALLEEAGDEHDSWDDFYLIENCIRRLGYIKDPNIMATFAWMIDRCLEKQYFDNRLLRTEKRTTPRKFDSLLEQAVRSLVDGVKYYGLRAHATYFNSVLTWNNTLAAYPFMDHVAEQLRDVMGQLFLTSDQSRPSLGYQGFGSASSLLHRILQTKVTDSQAEQWLDRCLRDPSDSWFAKERAKNGKVAAEKKLAEFVQRRGLYAFADSVNEVAQGLLALAQLDDSRPAVDADADPRDLPAPPHVRVVYLDKDRNFPVSGMHNGGILILGTNPSVPGCGCNQPEGSDVFGRGGEIGLRSVGIMVDFDLRRPHLVLTLPHPDYRTGPNDQTRMGFAVVTIDVEGHSHGTAVDYRFQEDPVEYALGLVDPTRTMSGSSSSSGVNAALRFPGSEEYLAKHISLLGRYLTASAAKLAGRHEH